MARGPLTTSTSPRPVWGKERVCLHECVSFLVNGVTSWLRLFLSITGLGSGSGSVKWICVKVDASAIISRVNVSQYKWHKLQGQLWSHLLFVAKYFRGDTTLQSYKSSAKSLTRRCLINAQIIHFFIELNTKIGFKNNVSSIVETSQQKWLLDGKNFPILCTLFWIFVFNI